MISEDFGFREKEQNGGTDSGSFPATILKGKPTANNRLTKLPLLSMDGGRMSTGAGRLHGNSKDTGSAPTQLLNKFRGANGHSVLIDNFSILKLKIKPRH